VNWKEKRNKKSDQEVS